MTAAVIPWGSTVGGISGTADGSCVLSELDFLEGVPMMWSTELVQGFDQPMLTALERIERKAFGEGALNAWVIVPFIRHGRVFVLRSNTGQLGAVAEYMRDFDTPERVYLFGLSVDERHQGQGLGSQLLLDSLQWLQENGVKTVELTVDPQNEPAVSLYDKVGFRAVETRQNEYGTGEHRLVMTRSLEDFVRVKP